MKSTGSYPKVHVDAGTVTAVGLDQTLSEALAGWRKALAIHDPGKIVLDLALSLVLGGEALSDIDTLRASPGFTGRWRRIRPCPASSLLWLRMRTGRSQRRGGGSGDHAPDTAGRRRQWTRPLDRNRRDASLLCGRPLLTLPLQVSLPRPPADGHQVGEGEEHSDCDR